MKISEHWLREWVNPSLTLNELSHKMTMAGLEVEECVPVADVFSGIVIAKVESLAKHPSADRLHVCEVAINNKERVTIVCGAENVRKGMKVAAALPGAVLSNAKKIETATIRGVTSYGMLCSRSELGLAESSEGLIEFSEEAVLGTPVWDYLMLNDYVMNVSITPNRGDCLSVMGLAKDVAAITGASLVVPSMASQKASIKDTLNVVIDAKKACPRYAGRIIKKVKADALTPIWMEERLRRAGQRSINAVVDVMNYVMLELGQPMHAFDLAKISGNVHVRMGNNDESIVLLDGQIIKPTSSDLVIADDQSLLALAGVMGGSDSAVTLLTESIFLESAYFDPMVVGKTARQLNLGSESSYRFERGIDPTVQVDALVRATELLLSIVGGEAGPITEVVEKAHLPFSKTIVLREEKLIKRLGLSLSENEVMSIFNRLQFQTKSSKGQWIVTVPARRSDITIEEDLIEEVARLYGYDQIPTHITHSELTMLPVSELKLPLSRLRTALCDLGYNEVVTYSFIDKALQSCIDPKHEPEALLNPMTSEMAVMRTTLWPGLLNAFLYNQNRQESRLRLFESGLVFVDGKQERRLGGLVNGPVFPEQWGIKNRAVDFFDLKGDLETLFALTLNPSSFSFKKGSHPALHPGQTAEVVRGSKVIGLFGRIHPEIAQKIDTDKQVYLFDLSLDELESACLPKAASVSKFPEIRRDIAILIDETVPSDVIRYTIQEVAGEWLKQITLFDVYQGKGIPEHQKSIALSLTIQHPSRTLVDEEVADLVQRVIVSLKEKLAAELRG